MMEYVVASLYSATSFPGSVPKVVEKHKGDSAEGDRISHLRGLGLFLEFFKTSHFSHLQVPTNQQSEEETKHRPFRRQWPLRLDPASKFLVDPLDDVGGANRLMQRPWKTPEGQQFFPGLFQAGGYRRTLLPPLLHKAAPGPRGLFIALCIHDPSIVFP